MVSEPTESARVHFIDAPHGLIVADGGVRIKLAALRCGRKMQRSDLISCSISHITERRSGEFLPRRRAFRLSPPRSV
jgi:hypothetical protein